MQGPMHNVRAPTLELPEKTLAVPGAPRQLGQQDKPGRVSTLWQVNMIACAPGCRAAHAGSQQQLQGQDLQAVLQST